MRAGCATAGVTTKTAIIVFQGGEGMFQPGLADLLEPIGISSAAAHAIKILRNNRVIRVRKCKPIERLITGVTGSCAHSEADEMIYGVVSVLRHLWQLADDYIGSGHQRRSLPAVRASQWRHHHRFNFAVNQLRYLNRLHRRADRDFSSHHAGVCRAPERLGKLI